MFKSITIFSILALSSLPLIAQNFSHKAKVKPAPQKAFYQMHLSPDVNAYCQTYHEDLRLFDDQGKEIPFILKTENTNSEYNNFNEYPIVENNTTGEWQQLVIHNMDKRSMNSIILEMKNADADRVIRISGSTDEKAWYVVRDNFGFSAYGSELNNEIKKQLDFPTSDYKFYKIEIKNKNKEPLNILRAGYSTTEQQKPLYQQIKGVTFIQSEINKQTKIKLSIKPSQRIDLLAFKISQPSLYRRGGQLIVPSNYDEYGNMTKSVKSIKRKAPSQFVSFELGSDLTNRINTSNALGSIPHDSIDIELVNQDNEPLKIDSILAFQFTTTLIAELKPERRYFLYFGDSSLVSPNYDLVYFQQQIDKNLKNISHEDIQLKNAQLEEEYNNSNDKYMVWIGLAIVAIILLWLTSSMLRKMKTE